MQEARSTGDGRALIIAALAVWGVAYAAWSADWLLQPMPYTLERMLRRLPVCGAGFALSIAMLGPLRASVGKPFLERLRLAVLICAGASLAQAVVNELVFYVIAPRWGQAHWTDLGAASMTVFWVFAGWTALYFAFEYDSEAREKSLRLAAAEAAAVEARNQALMQQVNPHFLFNALNTVSGLIVEGDAKRADATVLSLARLMRRSLDQAPPDFRPLSAEIEAQIDYVDVQRARFGERFDLKLDVAPEARDWQVPSLILQPLIENVFTHGVGLSEAKVTLSLRAEVEAGKLVVHIDDDARPLGRATATTGLGLANVERRLAAIYGGAASLQHGARSGGGFEVTLRVPARS